MATLTGNDKTYADIMSAVQNAKDQNSINAARNRLGELNNIGAGSAASTFSSILDKAQQGLGPTAPAAYNPADDINKLKEAQRAQTIASLSKARDNSLANLNTEKAAITPKYNTARNSEAVGSQIQAKNFAEYLANRNQTNSGTSAQAEISRNVGLQGAVNNLNVAERQAFDDVARRETATNNAYNSDLASANAGIEANALNQLIAANQQAYNNALNQYNADRAFNYQTGRDTVTDARADKSLNWSMDAWNNPALRGQVLNNDAQTMQNMYLPMQLQNQVNGQVLQNNAQTIQNQYLPQQLQGQVTNQELQNAYQRLINQGYPEKEAAQLAQIYAGIRQGDAQIAVSQQNANTNSAQLAWAKDPNNPGNVSKSASNKQYDEYYDKLFNLRTQTTKDEYGNPVRAYSDSDLIGWIGGLNLSPEEKAQLANDLGLSKGLDKYSGGR